MAFTVKLCCLSQKCEIGLVEISVYLKVEIGLVEIILLIMCLRSLRPYLLNYCLSQSGDWTC